MTRVMTASGNRPNVQTNMIWQYHQQLLILRDEPFDIHLRGGFFLKRSYFSLFLHNLLFLSNLEQVFLESNTFKKIRKLSNKTTP